MEILDQRLLLDLTSSFVFFSRRIWHKRRFSFTIKLGIKLEAGGHLGPLSPPRPARLGPRILEAIKPFESGRLMPTSKLWSKADVVVVK